jgi:hypothetical protein
MQRERELQAANYKWQIVLLLSVAMTASVRADEGDGDGPRLPAVGRPDLFDEDDGPIGVFQTPVIKAAPTEVQVEDPITLTIRVRATGKVVRAPKQIRLEKIPEVADSFYVEYPDDPVFHRIDDRTWEFICTLKPRRTNVTAVPSFPFVFFVPGLLPPERGYQVHRTESLPITVRPRAEVQESDVARGVESMPIPESVHRITEGSSVLRRESHSSVLLLIIGGGVGFLAPASAFFAYAIVWPRLSPSAEKRASARRSLAAKKALSALARMPADAESVERAGDVLARYLRERFEPEAEEPTPSEVQRLLLSAGADAAAAKLAADFFRTRDAVRYAHIPSSENLLNTAREIVLFLEAGPCPASAS